MAINISAQYGGGLLPDMILLTQSCYHWGTRLNAMKSFCLSSLWFHLPVNVLMFSPLIGGCLEGLDAFRFSLKIKLYQVYSRSAAVSWSLGIHSATYQVPYVGKSIVYCFYLTKQWKRRRRWVVYDRISQHDGGFLPGIILLTQRYYHRGTRLNAMKSFFCICSLLSYLKVLKFFPLSGGCSEGLDAFRFFLKCYFADFFSLVHGMPWRTVRASFPGSL